MIALCLTGMRRTYNTVSTEDRSASVLAVLLETTGGRWSSVGERPAMKRTDSGAH